MTGFVILSLYLHSAAPASHHVSRGVVAWLRLTSGKGLSPLIQAKSAGVGWEGGGEWVVWAVGGCRWCWSCKAGVIAGKTPFGTLVAFLGVAGVLRAASGVED